ncbi:MAG: CsbD family protein [Mycobacteriales bacterium]
MFSLRTNGYPSSAMQSTASRRCTMSLVDKGRNKAEELIGKAKEKTGEASDDRDLQAEGQKDQAKSNLKQAG